MYWIKGSQAGAIIEMPKVRDLTNNQFIDENGNVFQYRYDSSKGMSYDLVLNNNDCTRLIEDSILTPTESCITTSGHAIIKGVDRGAVKDASVIDSNHFLLLKPDGSLEALNTQMPTATTHTVDTANVQIKQLNASNALSTDGKVYDLAGDASQPKLVPIDYLNGVTVAHIITPDPGTVLVVDKNGMFRSATTSAINLQTVQAATDTSSYGSSAVLGADHHIYLNSASGSDMIHGIRFEKLVPSVAASMDIAIGNPEDMTKTTASQITQSPATGHSSTRSVSLLMGVALLSGGCVLALRRRSRG